ncbi:S8 family serine peptidase [Sphingomonas tabacisoli]|uniref:S8 family serine peptidase n=1 Tax=Sphingomonas tabacisoli TaxID=2249466 RepID=A0ABW4I1B9_9SPHN
MTGRLRTLLRSAALAALATSSPSFADDWVIEPITGLETPTKPLYGTLDPFYGAISPFYGTLTPFYGNISPFWGSLNPFYGNLTPFWGDLNPFYSNIGAATATSPALSDIGHYWEQFGAQWQGKESLWTGLLTTVQLQTQFNKMVADAQTFWGPSVTATTGKSFQDAFLKPLYAKYGIDPNRPLTLTSMSSTKRSQFFLDWYDGLMAYSGTDRVDHWMREVNWTPAITQQQGSGTRAIIGLLDGTATSDPDIADNVAYSGGYNSLVNGHGVGVASLMVAAHDGKGVMGIAPNATVIAYNPFDATNTASWSAVRQGILSLASRNASVINMSLGQPGYVLHPDWRKIFFDPAVYQATQGRVFVMAAGNDGVVQTGSMRWDWSRDPNLILVGSTDINGNISTFSNTPGDTCLTDGTGACREKLMNRFMVAPGELMLVPDGQGGFVRRNGTSFAAPLVSGAITLLHDRWPWLAQHPKETVDILLNSAKDLGAPGVDPVYGHGLLDVQASQSPLDFNKLQFFEVRKGVMTPKAAPDLRAAGIDTTWEADGVYFNLYEPIGETFRDFSVPVSSLLVGKVGTLTGASEYFQRFVEGRLKDWVSGKTASFSDFTAVRMIDTPTLQVTASTTGPRATYFGSLRPEMPHTAMRIANPSGGFGFSVGFGDGSLALNGQSGFGLATDHDTQGGVNPVLGLASGGAFAAADAKLSDSTTLSVGFTQQRLVHGRSAALTDAERQAYRGVDPFLADGLNIRITHQASAGLTLSASLARVHEHNGLLGVQSRLQSDLGNGAITDTATMSATLEVGGGFTLAASGTAGRTHAGASSQGFSTGSGGILSSAFAFSATKTGLLGHGDALRVSLVQPLHIESGKLSYRSVGVVNRETGELGVVDQRFGVGGQNRPYAAELLYAAPLPGDRAEIGLFGRADLQSDQNVNQFAVGGRLNVHF